MIARRSLDAELLGRAPGLFTRVAIEETLAIDPRPRDAGPGRLHLERAESGSDRRPTAAAIIPAAGSHHGMSRTPTMPAGLAPQPELDALQERADPPDSLGFWSCGGSGGRT